MKNNQQRSTKILEVEDWYLHAVLYKYNHKHLLPWLVTSMMLNIIFKTYPVFYQKVLNSVLCHDPCISAVCRVNTKRCFKYGMNKMTDDSMFIFKHKCFQLTEASASFCKVKITKWFLISTLINHQAKTWYIHHRDKAMILSLIYMSCMSNL